MTSVDGNAARRIIREESRSGCERLRLQLIERARRADAVAETLPPWLGKAWVRDDEHAGKRDPSLPVGAVMGYIRPDARQTIIDAYTWACNFAPFTHRNASAFPLLRLPNFRIAKSAIANAYTLDFICFYKGECDRCERPGVDEAIRLLYQSIRQLSDDLKAVHVGRLLDTLDEVHPPRYARLKGGVLARVFTEELDGWLDLMRELPILLKAGTVPRRVTEWSRAAAEFLELNLESEVAEGFRLLTQGVERCDDPFFFDVGALRAAYMTLGLAYLEEVKERVPDYAALSGQEEPQPSVSVTISGGTFNGQIAAKIENINSTIAGVVQRGDAEVARALQELEQAVLTQQEFGAEQRRDLLDNIEYLAQAAQSSPEKRNRGIIRSVLAALTAAATTGTELGKAVETWGLVLHRLVS